MINQDFKDVFQTAHKTLFMEGGIFDFVSPLWHKWKLSQMYRILIYLHSFSSSFPKENRDLYWFWSFNLLSRARVFLWHPVWVMCKSNTNYFQKLQYSLQKSPNVIHCLWTSVQVCFASLLNRLNFDHALRCSDANIILKRVYTEME